MGNAYRGGARQGRGVVHKRMQARNPLRTSTGGDRGIRLHSAGRGLACKPNPSNPSRDVRRDIAGLLLKEKRPLNSVGVFRITGGDRGIRTLDTGLSPYASLAGKCLRPLGQVSKLTTLHSLQG